MPNYLIHENSPYLLQHANNPVDWYPWGAEAFEKARQEDKPIFLSIGYAACHWCHVMAHESFENPAVAALMNQYFINIKVDREERPDIDSIYMQAVVALTQQGGWPMSVFLTPDGKPFYGGTYFPPVRRYNMPAFPEVLQAIAQIWLNDRSRLLESSQELAQHLQQSASLDQQPGATLKPEILQHAAEALAKNYDWTHGGWGRAPKFPQPMAIEFLLRRTVGGDLFTRDIALHALRAMAKGGMYDVVGGGFARYSVDDLWLIPHFEKMLYDNAQLALVYLHAYLLTGDTGFRQICEETLDFIQREMTHPEGGFFSSLDADSEGEEGKFYLWSRSEIEQTLSPEESRWITAAFGVTENGNFEGKNILQRVLSDEKLAEKFNVKAAEVPAILKIALSRLLTARSSRVRPGTDDKVLVFWNSMALAAFAEAGRYLERADYLETARHNAQFLLNKLYVDNRLLRSWRAGQSRHNAYLEDYAGLVQSLLALYMSDPDPRWYQSALQLCDEMIAHFSDPKGGFFDTRDDHEALLYRPKELNDNATPSGNALAACAILQLAAYGDRTALVSTANKMIISMQDAMVRYPSAFAQWLCAADFALGAIQEVAVIGDPHNAQTQALQRALWQNYRPHLVAAVSDIPPAPGSPALLADRPMLAGSPTAYVCQGFVCQQPVTSPQAMLAQLNTR